MRLRMILLAPALASALTACAASNPSADGILLTPPEVALLTGCRDPSRGLLGAETAAEQERLWRSDRLALADCRDRHAALAAWARLVVPVISGAE